MLLTPQVKRVVWPEAKVTLWLTPLPANVDQRFVDECLYYDTKPDGSQVQLQDSSAHAALVGNYCIKDWKGVTELDENKKVVELEITPEAIEQFMLIEPAQNFVYAKVKGLALWLEGELDQAKKD